MTLFAHSRPQYRAERFRVPAIGFRQ